MMVSDAGNERPNRGLPSAVRRYRRGRVLMLAPELAAEGGFALGWHIRGLARALSARSWEVHIATAGPDTGERFAGRDVHIHCVDRCPPFRAPDRVADVLQGEAALVTAALRASADAGPFDLLHAHGWAGAAAAHSLRRVLRLPLVFTLHRLEHLEPESYQPQELAYIQELLAWICQQAERVICSSRFAVAEAIRVHGLPPQKVNLSPAAVDPNEWQTDADLAAFRQLFGVEGGRLITFAGRLTHAKGPQVLLEAFPHILAVAPDARMAIAGEGPLGPWLLRRAQELGVGSEVTCTGYLRGKVLATLLCASDVCVLPSLMEASGQGAAEAMGGGIPVVASVTGGLPELIAQEEDGLLVPPGDVKALAAAIVRVLYDRELRTRLAINGRRRILAGHAWPTVVDSVLHSYAAAQQGRAVPCEGR